MFKYPNLVSVHPKSIKLGQMTFDMIQSCKFIDWLKSTVAPVSCGLFTGHVSWHEENAGILALHNKCCWMCCYSAVTRKLLAKFSSPFRSFYLFSRRRSHQKLFRSNFRFFCMANEPPAKRTKKETAETSHNNGADESIVDTLMAKRQKVCKSVADFKFDKKRVRLITSNADMPEICKGIAYWMWREQRVQGN